MLPGSHIARWSWGGPRRKMVLNFQPVSPAQPQVALLPYGSGDTELFPHKVLRRLFWSLLGSVEDSHCLGAQESNPADMLVLKS